VPTPEKIDFDPNKIIPAMIKGKAGVEEYFKRKEKEKEKVLKMGKNQ